MFADLDLTALPVAELVKFALAHGVAFHVNPHDSTALIVHPHHDPAMASLVTALRARREEVVAFLFEHRPQRPGFAQFAQAETLFRDRRPFGNASW